MTIQPDKQYLEFLEEGRFMLLRDRRTGKCMFYPRVAQPLTGSMDLEWIAASGLGVVYSTSVMRQRNPGDDYNVALIDLEEGVRMMSRVEGIRPQDVQIGMHVKADILSQDGQPLVVFRPA